MWQRSCSILTISRDSLSNSGLSLRGFFLVRVGDSSGGVLRNDFTNDWPTKRGTKVGLAIVALLMESELLRLVKRNGS